MEDEKKVFEEFSENVKEAAEEVLEDMKEQIEEIIEAIDFEAKYKEALASMENLRKRVENDKADFIKYRAASFIINVLPTLDMFEMAMSANNVSEEVKNWLVGFEMILRNFKSTLEAEGVVEINTKPGDEFDSSIHHAIEERVTDEFEPGKVVQVKQKGYKLHDRLLRPAAVVVGAKKEQGDKDE